MADAPNPQLPKGDLAARLKVLAQLLRNADHLESEAQGELADLIAELADAVEASGNDSSASEHLAESTAHLAQSLHEQPEPGVLAAAKARLESSILRAQSEAPAAAGFAKSILEVLANLGI